MKKFVHLDELGRFSFCGLMLLLIGAAFMIGWSTLYTIVVKRFGIEFLPVAMIGGSIVTLITAGIYLFLSDKTRREWLLAGTAALCAAALFYTFNLREVFSGVYSGSLSYLLLVFGLVSFGVASVAVLLPVQVWTLINDVFRPIQAKRLYPIFAVLGLVGGMISGVLIPVFLKNWGGTVDELIVVWAIIVIGIIPLAFFFRQFYGLEFQPVIIEKKVLKRGGIKNVFEYIWRNPSGMLIVALAFCYYTGNIIQDVQYNRNISATLPNEEALSSFYGYYTGIRNVVILLLQFFVATLAFRKWGLFRILQILPSVYLIGFVIITLRFQFWEGVSFRFFWDVCDIVFYSTGIQLLFNVIPLEWRAQARGVCLGLISAVSYIIGGGILIGAHFLKQSLHFSSNGEIILINSVAIILALLWLKTVYGGRQTYVKSLVTNVQTLRGQDLIDSIESLEEPHEDAAYQLLVDVLLDISGRFDVETKGKAMAVLSRTHLLKALRVLALFLKSPDRQLRLYAIIAIRDFPNLSRNPFAYHTFVTEMKRIFRQDTYGPVRLEAGRFLVETLPREEIIDFLTQLMEDPDPLARILAIQTFAQMKETLIDLLVANGLYDPDPEVRSEAVFVLWRYKDYRIQGKEVLTKLLEVPDTASEFAGLKTIIRLGLTMSFLSHFERLIDDYSPEVRSLAALGWVILIKKKSVSAELEQDAMETLTSALSIPEYSSEYRYKLVELFSSEPEEVIDAVLIAIASLPYPQRDVAKQGFEMLSQHLVHHYEEEESALTGELFARSMR